MSEYTVKGGEERIRQTLRLLEEGAISVDQTFKTIETEFARHVEGQGGTSLTFGDDAVITEVKDWLKRNSSWPSATISVELISELVRQLHRRSRPIEPAPPLSRRTEVLAMMAAFVSPIVSPIDNHVGNLNKSVAWAVERAKLLLAAVEELEKGDK